MVLLLVEETHALRLCRRRRAGRAARPGGHHIRMLEPDVRPLMTRLRQQLQAQGGGGGEMVQVSDAESSIRRAAGGVDLSALPAEDDGGGGCT